MLTHTPILLQLLICGVLYLILLPPCLYLVNRYIPEEDAE